MIIDLTYKRITALLKNVYYKQVSYGKFLQTYLRLPNWIYGPISFTTEKLEANEFAKLNNLNFSNNSSIYCQTKYIKIIRKDIW